MKSIWGWLLLAACATDPKTIDVAIPGTQVLVAEKIDSGAWKPLTGSFAADTNRTMYSVEIGDEVELVAVCLRTGPNDAGQFVANELFATGDDAEVTFAVWYPPDCTVGPDGYEELGAEPLAVTGTFDEATLISIGNRPAKRVMAGLPFTYNTNPGTHDLIAVADTRLAIERGRAFDTNALAPVSFAREGKQMLAIDVGALLATTDTIYNVTTTITTRGRASLSLAQQDIHAALFAPAEILEPGDSQNLLALFTDVASPEPYRWLSIDDPYQFWDETLLSPIESATPHPGNMGMTWTPIPEFFTTAMIYTNTLTTSSQLVAASKAWLDRHGKNQLDFDLDVDGYDPSWTTTEPYVLDLRRWNPGRISTSSYYPSTGRL